VQLEAYDLDQPDRNALAVVFTGLEFHLSQGGDRRIGEPQTLRPLSCDFETVRLTVRADNEDDLRQAFCAGPLGFRGYLTAACRRSVPPINTGGTSTSLKSITRSVSFGPMCRKGWQARSSSASRQNGSASQTCCMVQSPVDIVAE